MILQLAGAFLSGLRDLVGVRVGSFALGFLLLAMPIPPGGARWPDPDAEARIGPGGLSAVHAHWYALSSRGVHLFAAEVVDRNCRCLQRHSAPTIALVLSALLMGHRTLTSGWSRVVLLLAVLPLSVLKNGLRIVSLSLLAMHVDPSFLAGATSQRWRGRILLAGAGTPDAGR